MEESARALALTVRAQLRAAAADAAEDAESRAAAEATGLRLERAEAKLQRRDVKDKTNSVVGAVMLPFTAAWYLSKGAWRGIRGKR